MATWEATGTNVHRRVDGLTVSISIPIDASAALTWVVSTPAIGADPTVEPVTASTANEAMTAVDASKPLPGYWTGS